jgi:addiction module HigA family antidote
LPGIPILGLLLCGHSVVRGQEATAYVLTISGGSFSGGPPRVRMPFQSAIITRGDAVKYKIDREPTPPGEILQEEFLTPLGFTQKQLADHIGCDVKVINRIVNGRTSVRAEMAVKLSGALNTTPQFWLNAQQSVDVYLAERKLTRIPSPMVEAR